MAIEPAELETMEVCAGAAEDDFADFCGHLLFMWPSLLQVGQGFFKVKQSSSAWFPKPQREHLFLDPEEVEPCFLAGVDFAGDGLTAETWDDGGIW